MPKLVNFPSEKGRFSFLLRSLHFGSNRLNLDCCVFVCLFVRFVYNRGLENILINVVYLYICGDDQESKQFHKT